MKINRSRLRKRLGKSTMVLPGAFNALCGLILKDIGYDGLYVSGAGLHNSAGKPDIGLLGLDEMSSEAKKNS